MKCTECEFQTTSAASFTGHLRRKHSTTLVLAGLALRCDCGVETRSSHHAYMCEIAKFTVVRMSEGLVRGIGDAKTTPQCLLCDVYPSTAKGYAAHLQKYHKSNLRENNIYLLCSCGARYRHSKSESNHTKECTRDDFTLHKVQKTPQCLLCDAYPSTACGYESHLHKHHKSSLSANGIYLLCSCGVKYRHFPPDSKHAKECTRRDFTLHKVSDEKSTALNYTKDESDFENEDDCESLENSDEEQTIKKLKANWAKIKDKAMKNSRIMKCTDCEFQTTSAGSFIDHLKKKHSTTLADAGLALRCDCGIETRSNQHAYRCEIANFTVVRTRGGPIQSVSEEKNTPQCLLCDATPTTARGYQYHLHAYHKSTLWANGIYLRCSCGVNYRHFPPDSKHAKECTRREYSLHKIGDE